MCSGVGLQSGAAGLAGGSATASASPGEATYGQCAPHWCRNRKKGVSPWRQAHLTAAALTPRTRRPDRRHSGYRTCWKPVVTSALGMKNGTIEKLAVP